MVLGLRKIACLAARNSGSTPDTRANENLQNPKSKIQNADAPACERIV
jgi:hypothetical protein